MLTYDSLIEQAKLKNMPAAKIRGILREYLQVLILKELYRTETGKKIYFTGGTYLRLTHNLKRFSEDLDFNTETVSEKEFESLLTTVKKELNKTGLVSRIEYAYWNNVYAGKLIFPDLEKSYNVVSKYSKKEGIVIKIETNKPAYKIKSETRVISGFGELYPCLCTDKGIIFADKIDALNKKNRARHIYDTLFMLSNKYPIDKNVFQLFYKGKDPLKVIVERINSFSKIELKKQARSLSPFLFDEHEADLIANVHDIILPLIEKYKIG